MKLYYYDHQTKGKPYCDALFSNGWTTTRNHAEADLMLIDCEINRHEEIQKYYDAGKPVFIYPHAARPDILPDSEGYHASPHVTAHFVPTKGQAGIMESYGYPNPLLVVGWSLCPIRSFIQSPNVKPPLRVLFAPLHSSRTGVMSEIAEEVNIKAFAILRDLVDSGRITLKIRYLYNRQFTGLPEVEHAGIEWFKGNPDLSYDDIDEAQVVVSHQTPQYLAVARGVATVGMGEGYPPHYTMTDGSFKLTRSLDKYKDLLRFPLDILGADDPYEMLLNAIIKRNEEVEVWKQRMIGFRKFDPDDFYNRIIIPYLHP